MASVIRYILIFLTIIAYSQAFSWDEYYDLEEVHEWMRSVASENPDHAEVIQAGVSYEGRPLLGLRISSDLTDTTRQIVMIESGAHGRSWEASASTTYFIEQMLHSSNADVLALKNQVEWHIFPILNPDGYVYSRKTERFWRKTRSPSSNGCFGVDMNRNWDYNYGQANSPKDPCNHSNYPGTGPFSEIETKSLSEYIKKISNRLVGYVGVYTFVAPTIYIPYADSTARIPDYKTMVQIGNVMKEYIKRVNGTEYKGPDTAAVLSYASSGTSLDWVYKTFSLPVTFRVEILGFQYPRSEITVQGDEFTQMMLGMITEANNLGLLTVPSQKKDKAPKKTPELKNNAKIIRP